MANEGYFVAPEDLVLETDVIDEYCEGDIESRKHRQSLLDHVLIAVIECDGGKAVPGPRFTKLIDVDEMELLAQFVELLVKPLRNDIIDRRDARLNTTSA